MTLILDSTAILCLINGKLKFTRDFEIEFQPLQSQISNMKLFFDLVCVFLTYVVIIGQVLSTPVEQLPVNVTTTTPVPKVNSTHATTTTVSKVPISTTSIKTTEFVTTTTPTTTTVIPQVTTELLPVTTTTFKPAKVQPMEANSLAKDMAEAIVAMKVAEKLTA